MQREDMDDALRNSLWNALELFCWEPLASNRVSTTIRYAPELEAVCRRIWVEFFKYPLDTLPYQWHYAKRTVRDFFFDCHWYVVYDFIEFIAQYYWNQSELNTFVVYVNQVLETEMSGYRLVEGWITPITDPVEIHTIEDAASKANKAVSEQLERALELLSDRENPDYRNSIKESISAVETQVRHTLGTEKGTLGELVKQLEQKAPLHPALRQALSSLYGYTADDSGGIRHALMEDGREVSFEEAKFMLVVCSAFINYVRGINKS